MALSDAGGHVDDEFEDVGEKEEKAKADGGEKGIVEGREFGKVASDEGWSLGAQEGNGECSKR